MTTMEKIERPQQMIYIPETADDLLWIHSKYSAFDWCDTTSWEDTIAMVVDCQAPTARPLQEDY